MADPAKNHELVKFDILPFLRRNVQELIDARITGMEMNRGKDIRAGGDEVEEPLRRVLQSRLPEAYHVGEGHIVNYANTQSPQLDVIITSRENMRVLYRGEKGTNYYASDSVRAIGECKSTYYESKKYIQQFSEKLRYIRDDMGWRIVAGWQNGGGLGLAYFVSVSPITFMFAARFGSAFLALVGIPCWTERPVCSTFRFVLRLITAEHQRLSCRFHERNARKPPNEGIVLRRLVKLGKH
jgi:hypothetical protein